MNCFWLHLRVNRLQITRFGRYNLVSDIKEWGVTKHRTERDIVKEHVDIMAVILKQAGTGRRGGTHCRARDASVVA